MRKRDELTNPSSCMNRAQDDEWTFVLLGRDVAAPAAVRAWIEERIRLGKNVRSDAQIVEAEAWCNMAERERNSLPVAIVPVSGVQLIQAERQRQILSEGFTTDHDDEHLQGEMALAAACYAAQAANEQLYRKASKVRSDRDSHQFIDPWPWDSGWDKRIPEEDSPESELPTLQLDIRHLVKAGALIAAEIDRLTRILARSA